MKLIFTTVVQVPRLLLRINLQKGKIFCDLKQDGIRQQLTGYPLRKLDIFLAFLHQTGVSDKTALCFMSLAEMLR
jgi:hypothetical protein